MSKELEKNELIAKWLNGDLTQQDKAKLTLDYQLADLASVLADISTWQLKPFDTKAKLFELQQKKADFKPQNKLISIQSFYKIAAVVVLGFCVFLFKYFDQQQREVTTALGENIKHEFPDGSIAHLAPNSSIGYEEDSWGEERNVQMSGQVYFEIMKGKVFTVSARTITVEVLGTRFEVAEHEEVVNTRCYEGKVRVSASLNQTILEKGHQVIISGNVFEKSEMDVTNPLWIGETLKFDNIVLSVVIVELLKYYNIEIDIPDKYQSLRYTGTVVKEDLNTALMSIFVPLEINYQVENGRVIFD